MPFAMFDGFFSDIQTTAAGVDETRGWSKSKVSTNGCFCQSAESRQACHFGSNSINFISL